MVQSVLVDVGVLPIMFGSNAAGATAPARWSITMSDVEIVAFSIVNGQTEEIFVCAFMLRALAPRYGVHMAVVVSCLVRVTYHFYQGPPVVFSHLAFGVFCCWLFLRWGRIWPIAVMHMLGDALPMLAAKYGTE